MKRNVDVAIAGAGPVGLYLSHLLSKSSISHVLLEARSCPSIHPQAHFVNTRTSEILLHNTPRLHSSVHFHSPPLSEYRKFLFLSSLSSPPLASFDHFSTPASSNLSSSSPTRPTHLAQNVLTDLFLAHSPEPPVKFSSALSSFSPSPSDPSSLTITTKDSSTYNCKYLVGADGAHSTIRSQLPVNFDGNPSLQSLMNVHFKTSEPSPLKENPAMLYFTYNSSAIAAFVAHDISRGELVAQIPFFPPFQTPSDFPTSRCMSMISKSLALPPSSISILSVRPWTMSSMVASSYSYPPSNPNVFLVGDAAHTFPPAGGFGMNTGIQDAHNLAWKLYGALRSPASPKTSSLLNSYTSERRPVARSNANLSLRNYERSLNVARSIGLDAEHPKLVASTVAGASPSSPAFTLVRSAFSMALTMIHQTLTLLESSPLLSAQASSRLQGILDSGGGLPLLFPRYELGFSYSPKSSLKPSDDLGLYEPVVASGSRLPHISVTLEEGGTISTVDIASVLQPGDRPSFAVLAHEGVDVSKLNSALCEVVSSWGPEGGFGYDIILVWLTSGSPSPDPVPDCPEGVARVAVGKDEVGGWGSLLRSSDLDPSRSIVSVRPDGHVDKIFVFPPDIDRK